MNELERISPKLEEAMTYPAVRRILDLAGEETMLSRNSFMGTEHLLLGIVRDGGSVAEILADMGVTVGKLRGAVEDGFKRFGEKNRDDCYWRCFLSQFDKSLGQM